MIRLRKTGAKKRAENFIGDGIGSSWVSDGGCHTAPTPPIPSKLTNLSACFNRESENTSEDLSSISIVNEGMNKRMYNYSTALIPGMPIYPQNLAL